MTSEESKSWTECEPDSHYHRAINDIAQREIVNIDSHGNHTSVYQAPTQYLDLLVFEHTLLAEFGD